MFSHLDALERDRRTSRVSPAGDRRGVRDLTLDLGARPARRGCRSPGAPSSRSVPLSTSIVPVVAVDLDDHPKSRVHVLVRPPAPPGPVVTGVGPTPPVVFPVPPVPGPVGSPPPFSSPVQAASSAARARASAMNRTVGFMGRGIVHDATEIARCENARGSTTRQARSRGRPPLGRRPGTGGGPSAGTSKARTTSCSSRRRSGPPRPSRGCSVGGMSSCRRTR